MSIVETVKIVSKNKSGYVVINKEDFTNKHTIFKEKELPKEKESPKKKEGAKNE
jgi:hypothetical protein